MIGKFKLEFSTLYDLHVILLVCFRISLYNCMNFAVMGEVVILQRYLNSDEC